MNNIPEVSVMIMEGTEIDFGFDGNYFIGNQETKINGQFKAILSGNMIVLSKNKKVYASKKPFQLIPENFNQDCFELKNVTIGINFHWEQKENQRFRGILKLITNGDKIQVINILDVETYLKSVISSEMRSGSSPELLKAHAVISRSWLFAQMEKQKKLKKSKYNSNQSSESELIRWYDREDHNLFDVCADDHCQRYQGINRAENPNVIEATNATSGQVLTYNGEVCDTRYSKCCGGASESFENVWEPTEHPYLQKVIDNLGKINADLDLRLEQNAEKWINEKPEAFCNTNNQEVLKQVLNDYDLSSKNFYRWKLEYDQKELVELIERKSGIKFGEIIDLVPVERSYSGRLIKLKIVGTLKTLVVGKELEIRRWLSPSHLYSSAFIVNKENLINGVPQKFILKGAGWGHGVGLCQIGAAVMGHQGYSYKEILEHYFKGAEIKKIY
jgi:stage II sporulation protein D